MRILSVVAMFIGMYASFNHQTDWSISMYFFSLLMYLQATENARN